MVEPRLTVENLPNICRLCLKPDDSLVDILNRRESKPNRFPLSKRIFDFFNIRVSREDKLPTNICPSCLEFTDSLTTFCSNVRVCERKLQLHIVLGIPQSPIHVSGCPANEDIMNYLLANTNVNPIDYSVPLPDDMENVSIYVVDPYQDYESSNESYSIGGSENGDDCSMTGENGRKKSNKRKHKKANSGQENVSMNINDSFEENTQRKVFLCQYCDMAFRTKSECNIHESNHDHRNPFGCPYCEYHSHSRQALINHIRDLHDPDRPYVCGLCNKGFGRRSDLKKHTIVHTGIRPFTCPVCGKNFSRNTNLTKHMRIHTGIKPHVCQHCPRSFTTTGDLMRHSKIHNEAKQFKCNICDSEFSRKDKLCNHERMHKKNDEKLVNNIQAPQSVEENIAGTSDANSGNLISLDPNSEPNPNPNIEQESIIDLVDTEEEAQASMPPPKKKTLYAIELGPNPGVTIKVKTAAKLSKKSLNKSHIHICSVCAKAFTRKRELQRHSVIHSGLKPFGCRFCSKRFNRKDKVSRHERTHTDEKFACSICKSVFISEEALALHVQEHELKTEPAKPEEETPKFPNFLVSLQEGVTPQLNFYSEIRPE